MKKNPVLQEFGAAYSAVESLIVSKVGKLSDSQARTLSRAVDSLNEGNCWWATYKIKPMVQYALEERGRMKRARSRKKRTPGDRTP
jgi:hypothetical protein